MSLVFGTRLSARIGVNASRLLLPVNLRAFQTLSAPPSSAPGDEKKSPHPAPAGVGNWNAIQFQSAHSVQFSSLSALAKWSSSPSCPNSAKFLAQTTRSLAGGAPDTHRDGKPTLEYAKKMPKTFASMSNDQILHIAELGIPEACRECVIRDVMTVDNVEYDEAMKTFKEIAAKNREEMKIASLPFYLGCGGALTAGIVSLPMVFSLPVVDWFNAEFVTADMPPEKDLETWLEVGAASWGWMEPVLGWASFFLLCMQFARSQLSNLGIRPYFHLQQERRARILVRAYPQYDAEFLVMYSKSDRLSAPHEMSD